MVDNTVEPIFNDISNSDNYCYNDRFANPCFFLCLSHTIYFYNNEYKKSLFSVIRTTWSESLGGKTERNAIRENNLKHYTSQSPPHKHRLTAANTFSGVASPISINQSLWSSQLQGTPDRQTRSMPGFGKTEGRGEG